MRFDLDENMNPEIADQLKRHSIEAFTVIRLGFAGDSDIEHLECAKPLNCVLCTHDEDFLRLAAQGTTHNGIAYGRQFNSTLGGWVRERRRLHDQKSPEDMQNQVIFLVVND
ncbi:MAG: DUF5615 family PIN-like protein [bacterium]|nr:DUF5615 family PIN-like protein [bacterium]